MTAQTEYAARRADPAQQADGRPERCGDATPVRAAQGTVRRGRLARMSTRWAEARDAAGDRGMATAEYAIATIAAVGLAGLLVVVLRSAEVQALLQGIIRTALST
ncbi:DUF4244 domain-containing protein [Cellulomonas chengniuliangii]|uniref:DUF4244 domain-containing protein n=1 Tax=Cellulomonas chengniuliangii TaxID=2968084 RepID=A0ABY5KWT6_9CELL|nr:DUF4244 domain-containing protein [Cellulomonas chengniuliangii]MCC2309485.1 DUF4244 domain-containing protein [Cellulomonas chengniuliangii]MCC2316756.1 DUF4244 domain-containing protein [Cellulomonas chengniuliangii]UUI74956.1 DUF4244 domain-containing protein [Cellulomonas chengniuliangii]